MSSLQKQWHESVNRFQQMPRIVRLGVIATVAIIVYLIWADYIAPASREMAHAADMIQRDRDAVRDGRNLAREINRMEHTIRGAGEVRLPRQQAMGEISLTMAVNEVMGKFDPPNGYSFRQRGSANLTRGPLVDIPGVDSPQRLSADLSFTTSPQDAIAIISELESRPEIEAITSVIINRDSNRRVNVSMTLEAWVVESGVPGRRTRS